MTTAASTEFCVEKVGIGNGKHLFIDGNQKITAGNGMFELPAPNAFSLPQVVTCPMRTPTCEASCYVHNLETHQGWLHDCYKHNLEMIREVLASPFAIDCARALADWIGANCTGGFRWHVSGDLFSKRYAQWVGYASRASSVSCWIYTRSFHLIDDLRRYSEDRNLTVNLSADADNYWLARRVADEHRLRVCYLTVDGTVPDDLREGDVVFPDYSLRGVGTKPHAYRDGSEWWQSLTGDQRRMVCPTDAYGKSENNRCGPCRKCLD